MTVMSLGNDQTLIDVNRNDRWHYYFACTGCGACGLLHLSLMPAAQEATIHLVESHMEAQ